MIQSVLNRAYLYALIKHPLYLLFALLSLFTAFYLQLYPDEAYYYMYGQHLDWGFFDHPPLVGVLTFFGSSLWHHEFGLRLFHVLFALILPLLIAILSEYKYPPHWILWALLSSFSFHLVSFTALPDMPLLFFVALYFIAYRYFLYKQNILSSLLLALSILAMLYTKYHGLLVVFFTLVSKPKWFKNYWFYFVMALVLAGYFPHLSWQIGHDYPSFQYHVHDRNTVSFQWDHLWEYLLGFLFYNGPFAFPFLLFRATKYATQNDFENALKWVAGGVFVVFLFASFRTHVEPNWTLITLIPITLLAFPHMKNAEKWFSITAYVSIALIIILRIHLLFPFPGITKDRIRDFRGHRELAMQTQSWADTLPIVTQRYQEASLLSFYLNKDIPAINFNGRKNQFDHWSFADSLCGQTLFLVSKHPKNKLKIPYLYRDSLSISIWDSLSWPRNPSITFNRDSLFSDSVRFYPSCFNKLPDHSNWTFELMSNNEQQIFILFGDQINRRMPFKTKISNNSTVSVKWKSNDVFTWYETTLEP